MTNLLKKLKNNKGFTLIELVIIIAILGTLTAVALPRFSDIQLDSEYKADLVTATSIGKAAELYFVKTREVATNISELGDYLSNTSVSTQYKGFGKDVAVEFLLTVSDSGLATVEYFSVDKSIQLYPNAPASRPTTFPAQ